MRGNSHVRCEVGENLEITSKDYLSLYLAKPLDTEKMIAALKQCMTDNRDIKLHEDL